MLGNEVATHSFTISRDHNISILLKSIVIIELNTSRPTKIMLYRSFFSIREIGFTLFRIKNC